MKPALLAEADIKTPPGWVLRTYLGLAPPQHFALQLLEKQAKSGNFARQFAHVAAKHYLIVRVRSGKYVALDPSVAVRAWALPMYWAELLALHNALKLHHVDHAFACLAAGNLSDYVPDRPWLVTHNDEVEGIEKIDRFHFSYKDPKTESLEIMGQSFTVKVTSPQETALLLAATGLPRERIAAKQILERHPPRKDVAKKLNFYGVPALRGMVESEEPGVRLPSFLEERRSRLGNELLRGGAA